MSVCHFGHVVEGSSFLLLSTLSPTALNTLSRSKISALLCALEQNFGFGMISRVIDRKWRTFQNSTKPL